MNNRYEIVGDIQGPRGAERAMRQTAQYLAEGVAGSCLTMKGRLDALGVAGPSPLLLARIIDALNGLGRSGNRHADEFAREVMIMRDKIASNPALQGTQHGWLSPRNNL